MAVNKYRMRDVRLMYHPPFSIMTVREYARTGRENYSAYVTRRRREIEALKRSLLDYKG